MYEEEFSQRLAQLRNKKGVSARDMSLSLGQNPSYINSIENGKAFPTMTNFFAICDYLDITPSDFFEQELSDPKTYRLLSEDLKKLNHNQLSILHQVVKEII